jgi:hypothetical protein
VSVVVRRLYFCSERDFEQHDLYSEKLFPIRVSKPITKKYSTKVPQTCVSTIYNYKTNQNNAYNIIQGIYLFVTLDSLSILLRIGAPG